MRIETKPSLYSKIHSPWKIEGSPMTRLGRMDWRNHPETNRLRNWGSHFDQSCFVGMANLSNRLRNWGSRLIQKQTALLPIVVEADRTHLSVAAGQRNWFVVVVGRRHSFVIVVAAGRDCYGCQRNLTVLAAIHSVERSCLERRQNQRIQKRIGSSQIAVEADRMHLSVAVGQTNWFADAAGQRDWIVVAVDQRRSSAAGMQHRRENWKSFHLPVARCHSSSHRPIPQNDWSFGKCFPS